MQYKNDTETSCSYRWTQLYVHTFSNKCVTIINKSEYLLFINPFCLLDLY